MSLFVRFRIDAMSTFTFLAGAISAAALITAAGYYTKNTDRKKYVDRASGEDKGNVGAPRVLEDPHWQWMISNADKESIILQLKLQDMPSGSLQVSSAAGHTVIGSYTWVQTDKPTIYAPGTAPEYTPPDLPITLAPDPERHFRDQNAGRAPLQPFEPLGQAVAVVNPSFRLDDVDIVIDRRSLILLLDFMRDKTTQAFCFTLDMVGKTMFVAHNLQNAKVSSRELTYGRSFEPAFTTEDPALEDAQGHYRLIKYDFGGLSIVVRLEVDARLPASEPLGH